jgi:hypothetical protein
MVPSREETSCGGRLISVVAMNNDDGTIEMFGEKARCKSPFLERQLSVFFASTKYRVVKIACSYSEVVL